MANENLDPKQPVEQDPGLQDLAAEKAAEYVNKLWEKFQDTTNDRRMKLISYYKQFRGKSTKGNSPGFADVVVNETLAACESIVSQIFHAIYSEARRFRMVGREETDKKREKLAENVVMAMLQKMGDKKKVLRSLRQMVPYGTTFAKICWKYEEREMSFNKESPGGGVQKVFEKIVTRNAPDLIFLDLLDVAYDPTVSDVEDMKWFIWRKWMDDNDFEEEIRKGRYSRSQYEKVKSSSSAKKRDYVHNRHQKLKEGGYDYHHLTDDKKEVLECWAFVPRWWVSEEEMDLDDPVSNELVCSVIEVCGTVSLRQQENPYEHKEIPILQAHNIQFDGEADGIGVCEITEKLQEELNAKRCQLLDHATLQIFPPLIINALSGIKKALIKIAPHFLISSNIDGDRAVTPMKIGGNPMEIIQSEANIKADVRHESGASNPQQGISGSGDETAYEISVLEKRASSRINTTTIDFGEKFLRRMYTLIFKLCQQYVDKDMAIQIVGKEGVRWENATPADLIGDYDFYPIIPTDLESRVIIRNQLNQFLQSIAPYFPNVNIYKIARKIYSTFGWDDTDDVIPAPETESGQGDLNDMEEIYVLAKGQKIDVKFHENHLHKVAVLQQYLAQNQTQLSPDAMAAFQDKIQQHIKYLETLQAAMQASGQETGGRGRTPKKAEEGQSPVGVMSDIQRSATR